MRPSPEAGNEKLLERFYAGINGGELDEAIGLLAPEVRWDRPPDVPVTGTLAGFREIREMWAAFTEPLERFEIEPTGFEHGGGKVLARVTFRGAGPDGEFEFSGAQVFTIRYGGITRVQEFRDLDQARAELPPGDEEPAG